MPSRREFCTLMLLGLGRVSIWGAATDSSAHTFETLVADLLDHEGTSPDTKSMHTDSYLAYILSHPRILVATKKRLTEGVARLESVAFKKYTKSYAALGKHRRQALLHSIAKEPWGEEFLVTVLGFGLESFFGDPIYGINAHEAGWRWVGHVPGIPRPREPFDG